ncbi:hypothetical protein VHEMI08737 [[Torrubiella] hemipterigena]|uniref:Tetratricopeptide SHNi-TPR domain-containing protein n=1 Tax=[Torrubiella] hemipterigena TaxID=1531966 RepID=A0A0A1TEE9_9HYPO|nr:hypothetical protein VHEMI08737 [[Torrubiella] hemipterigena]
MSGSAQQEQAAVEVNKQVPAANDAAAADAAPAIDESAAQANGAEEPELDDAAKKALVTELTAKGASLYSQKNFEEAAEIFSKATALQAELNGETAPENAEVLFYYGRSLFKVGQSKSDVLGGQAAGEKKPNGKPAAAEEPKEAAPHAAAAPKEEAPKEEVPDAKKPLFQFTGDENFDGSDDEEGEGEAEEEEDDLATSFEILDLARVCYIKQLEKVQGEGKGKETGLSAEERLIKERLADTHDALAEISLENERYPNAIEDGRVSLKYKMELYPEESEIIAEAHYKLSLALEFASITVSEGEGEDSKPQEMDQAMRDEAVKEMELAIKSFKLKLAAKQSEITAAGDNSTDIDRKAVVEMKEVIMDMEQRLVDLRKDPIDTKDFLSGPDNLLGGLFGAISRETAEQTKARVEEATKNANDLTSLVRKKPKAAPAAPAPISIPAPSKNKRKAEDDLEEPTGSESPKKAKVDE